MSKHHQPHVLFVIEFYYPHVGGAETLFRHLAEGLVKHGYQVTVITLWQAGTATDEVHEGVHIVRVRTPNVAQRYLFMLYALPLALRYARQADIIHTTTYNAALPAWIVSRLARRPAVITVHEVFGDQWQKMPGMNPLIGWAYRLVEWGIIHLPFQHFICDSAFTGSRLRQFTNLAANRTSTVYPAVDYDFWKRHLHQRRDLHRQLALPLTTSLYLYFGRVGISKGVEYLVEAARTISRVVPESRGVLILARDPLAPYQRLRRMIQDYGLEEHLIVLDPVPRADLPGYLLAANCVVIPSISEGFGYAAVEAATIGCTVVATTGHAVEEVLRERIHFVPPRNPQKLAQGVIQALLEQPEWQEPERYDVAEHIQGVETVYQQITANTR